MKELCKVIVVMVTVFFYRGDSDLRQNYEEIQEQIELGDID